MSLDTRLEDRVGRIIFNRPAVHNALSTKMWQEIPVVVAELIAKGARVLTFSGAGDSFAAGADLSELREIKNREDAALIWDSINQALEAIALAAVPTIALVNGPCLGGGCLIATACDWRLAAEEAIFAVPVAKLSIKLSHTCVQRLNNLIGSGQTRRLLFQAVTINSEEARRIGLVEEVFPADKLAAACDAEISMILANSAESISFLKQVSGDIALPEERETIIESYLSEEFRSRLAKALK